MLNRSQCTYDEAEELLTDLLSHYRQLREQKEFNTVRDYINGDKSRNVGSVVVPSINLSADDFVVN